MMIGRAATGLSRLDEHVRAHMPAAEEPRPARRSDADASAPYAPSAPWSCASPARTPRGVACRSSRQREQSFGSDPREAEDFALKIEHDKKAHVFIDPRAGRATFRAEAQAWLGHHLGADSSIATYRSVLRTHVYPAIGDKPGPDDATAGFALALTWVRVLADLALRTAPAKLIHV